MNTLHLIALGANLPAPDGACPRFTCEQALHRLAALPGLTLQVRSRWFSTAPVPPSDQPRFINGIVRLAGSADPAALIAALHQIEQEAGRTRGVLDAARTLDLDIIDMAGAIRDAPDPVLPHPRCHLRAFVLLPLRDVAPQWQHPRLKKSVSELISLLPAQDVRPV
jgi:2-amino-4-hydroxy-6-hydroxymethyldihydropteridine diphosphokinase